MYCEEYWCREKNVGIDFAALTVVGPKKYFFKCSDCLLGKQHVVYITFRTAEKRARADLLPCLQCHPHNGPSILEGEVHSILQKRFPHLEYITECRILQEFKGAVDFTILDQRMMIRVDGPMHHGRVGWTRAEGVDQQAVDNRCNDAALQQGWHMLRIHGDDLQHSELLIEQVLQRAVASRQFLADLPGFKGCSVTWSPSFNKERVEYKVDSEGQLHTV